MTEIIASLGAWFKERTTSPLYGTFIVSVILWNWEFFYVLFWEDESKLSLPKIEYVQKNIINVHSFAHNLSFFLIFPAISAWVIILWFPIISNYAHKKATEFYFQRKLIYDKANIEYEKSQRDILSSLSEVKKEQVEKKKEIEKIDPMSNWQKEYLEFKNSNLFGLFPFIIDSIYKYNGDISRQQNYQEIFRIPTSILVFCHTNDLITIDKQKDSIELTEKGKFFVRQSSVQRFAEVK